MIALAVFLGFIGLLAYLIRWINERNASYWPKQGVQVADPGSFLKRLITMDLSIVKSDMEIYRQLKGQRFGGFMELYNPVLYLTDLDLMKSVYIKDFDHFTNRRGFDVEKQDPHMHYSLFNQNGESWKNLRSKMSPTFTTGKIRRMFEIYDSSTQKLVRALTTDVQREIGKSPSGVDIEIRPFLQKVTMDVIASSAFGVQTDLFEEPNSMFAKMGKKIQQQFAGANFIKFFVIILFGPKFSSFFRLKFTDSEADSFLSRVIVDSLNHRTKTGEVREDFLQIMLEARAGQLKQEEESALDTHEKDAKLKDGEGSGKIDFTDDLIIAQCLLFILGGFDTVESALIFAMYELAVNQDVQEKLLEELEKSLGNNGKFSYDTINNMEYLDMVLSESLRKFPPAVRTERRSTKPYKIPGSDLVLPKDSLVAMPVYPVHHDADIWPDPEKFDPMRFTKEEVAKRHPMAYQPFGHGPRNCIGNRFALTECKTIIAHLTYNFKFEPSAKTEMPPKFALSGSLKPEGGMWLKVSPRKSH